MNQNKITVSNVIKQGIACILSLAILIPFLLVIINSFKTKQEAVLMNFALPKEFQWQNYITVIQKGKLVQSFLNSILYASGTMVFTILATSMAAFVLARRRTKLNQFIYFFIILGIMLPLNFVALMKVMQILHLINSRIGLIILYTAMQVPFGVFIIYGFVGTIPREIDEAAVIDGAGPWKMFFSIIFPLLKPVLVTVMLLVFMGAWNDFITPLYMLNTASKWPMTLAVYSFFGRYESEWNLVFADIVLTCLPVFIVYLLGQNQIVSGMTSGAVKG
ncbi:carbohydrate ABC transporter permease [Mahella australiensis]|uniref:Carbohydrate ABC transporter membrane protein 2, CUT1 family n=1 Tax=Mahella australiensis (strain DSM 15567 / CIP 107919 / 50-1 BON) TaxID=697281 RepID=F3ZY48_MAHA5|nr:carbohydrate ABC transporter permease [Mahella australiensis]AEE97744.1 carbohydrate ABC transporter membrane protein 2, CUT1 family [Mahella australiensis 50-1 BON]